MSKKTLFVAVIGSLLALVLISARQISPIEIFSIEGKILDSASGDPLVGAVVKIVGTTERVVTDGEGLFRLDKLTKCTELLIEQHSYHLYQTGKICKDTMLTIYLDPSVMMEDELVVVGYGKPAPSRKKDKASAASLAGRVAGVVATPQNAKPIPSAEKFNTEDYSTIAENRFIRPLKTPLSTFSIDVDAASYSNIRRFIQQGQLPPKDAVRIEEMINYFDYDYPQPQGYEPFTVTTELGPCPWQEKHRLLHIGLQGRQMPTAQLPASNLVFLLDVSGSMYDYNKLPLLKESLNMLVDNLRPADKVAIVVYAGAAGEVLPATSGADKQRIKDVLDQLEAGGSTAGGEGIQLAYEIARKNFVENGNNRVILATDGDFNVGASSDAELVRLIEKERESGVFLTVLGFGMGNYKDNKMQQLADKGNGNHAYIDNINEARKVLVNEFGGTLYTIAKDVKLQIEFNPAQVAGYRLIGYENRLLADEDFADDTKDAGELGAGHTVTALYEIIPAGVESEFLADAGELKYQQPQLNSRAASDWCTIKLRYKEPKNSKSELLELVVDGKQGTGATASDNFYWSAAVAEWGMLLRESEFKGAANWEHCRTLAEKAKGHDRNGYRAEMIDLIGKMTTLKNDSTAGK